jgi:MFS family permease
MPTYMIATVAYLGATLGCVFAHTAEVLVLFRALQGAGGKQEEVGRDGYSPDCVVLQGKHACRQACRQLVWGRRGGRSSMSWWLLSSQADSEGRCASNMTNAGSLMPSGNLGSCCSHRPWV